MKAVMQEISDGGNIPYMAVWGNKWTYKKREVGYDGWQRFEREGTALAVLNERGEIAKGGGTNLVRLVFVLAARKLNNSLSIILGTL